MAEYFVKYTVALNMPALIAKGVNMPGLDGSDIIEAKSAKEAMEKAEKEYEQEMSKYEALGLSKDETHFTITDIKKV